jgi:diadenosine tetraphosphate (Ap4A) HIT family hydrolase
MSCALCTVPPGDLVYEDDETRVVLHDDRSPLGHAMVISKQHVENPSDLDERAWLQLARVWQRAEKAILDMTGADRAIILKLGIVTPHLHVHIYPMPSTATREDVFAAFDGQAREEQDEKFVALIRREMKER